MYVFFADWKPSLCKLTSAKCRFGSCAMGRIRMAICKYKNAKTLDT